MKKRRVKYVSIKLPACGKAYPLDNFGCRKLPDYDADYLKKHGKKLFEILLHKVPANVYSEVVRCIRERENF